MICLVGTYLVQHNPFFWDTIQLSSKHAHFYYENNFQSFFLPNELDSGHPPFMGLYLALVWSIFGKSLEASHWAMLPFLVGIAFNLYWLLQTLLEKNVLLSTLIVLSAPVILGQAALISPDIVLLFWFVWTIRCILQDKPWGIILGVIGLCLISLRGMMTAGAIGLYYLYHIKYSWSTQKNIKLIKHVGPGYLAALLFLVAHYFHTNWIGFHDMSPWNPSFQLVNFTEFLHNCMIIGWRFIDLGLIWVWIITIPIIYRAFTSIKKDKKFKKLLVLLMSTLVFLLPTALLFYSLSGHRYFLPCFTALILIALYLIDRYAFKYQRIILLVLFIGLFTGNFWIYPERISQGWDSTLAHLPYHQVRTEMVQYLEENDIPADQVGSFFPNISTFKYTDLVDKPSFVEAELKNSRYILYSNIFNVNDQIWDHIKDLKPIKTIQCGPIYMKLYDNRVQ